MFRNLVESGSHVRDIKRKGKFFFATLATYAVLLCAAGVGSIYAYNVRLDDREELELLSLMVFKAPQPEAEQPKTAQPKPSGGGKMDVARIRDLVVITPYERPVAETDAPVINRKLPYILDPNATTDYIPSNPSTTGSVSIGPSTAGAKGEAPYLPPADDDAPMMKTPPKTDPPKPEPPKVLKLTSTIIQSKAISKPVPVYPDIAKRIGQHGTVAVQILIDESGRVVSAQATSGPAFLQRAAQEAALRARFTPTILGGQPVKVSGVIFYNFVLN